jgi:hypothetical protein
MAMGMIAAGLNQSAANKGVRPVNPGLNKTATEGLGGAAGPGFMQLLSMMKTGNPVDTQGMEQGLQATNKLQTQQGLAGIRERFGASGLSASSPAAIGEGNFIANQNADFLNTIANLRYRSATDATNREMMATEFALSSLFGPAFQMQGPKGSVPGAVLGTGQNLVDQLMTLGMMSQMNFGTGG